MNQTILREDEDLVALAEEVDKTETMSGKIKYDLREKINSLTPVDHICLFKIMYKHNYKKVYTATNSGTFFDLNDLDNKTLWKIEKFISLTLNKIEQDRVLEKQEHERKVQELATKNKPREKKGDDSLIPRNNKQKASTNTSIYDEIMSGSTGSAAAAGPTSVTAVRTAVPAITKPNVETSKATKVPMNPSNALSMFMNGKTTNTTNNGLGSSFIGGALCITDDDLNSEVDNTHTNQNDGTELDTLEDDDEDGLEDEEEDEEEEDEEDEEEEELDPNQIIRNGGQVYLDD